MTRFTRLQASIRIHTCTHTYIYNHIELKISHPLPVSMVHISVKSHHTAKPKRKYPIDSLSYSQSNFKESFELNDCFAWFHPFTAANSTQKACAISASNENGKVVRCWHVRAATFGHSEVITQGAASSHVHCLFIKTTWKCPFVTFLYLSTVFLF